MGDSFVHSCTIKKVDGESSFGFGVSQPVGTPHIVVKTIKDNGPAHREGLQLDDYILVINGKSLLGLNIKGVGEIIRSAQDGFLEISYFRKPKTDDDSDDETDVRLSMPTAHLYESSTTHALFKLGRESDATPQPDPIYVHALEKWKRVQGYGFSIQQRADGYKYLVRIEPNTPAFASGIRNDSVLCRVNSDIVLGRPYPEVVALIKASGEEVVLAVTSIETVKWLEHTRPNLDGSFEGLNVVKNDAPPEPPVAEVRVEVPEPAVIIPLIKPIPIYRVKVIKNDNFKGYGFSLSNVVESETGLQHIAVTKVTDQSPAYEAGLEKEMVIFRINGETALGKSLAEMKPVIAANPNEVEFCAASIPEFKEAVIGNGVNLIAAAETFEIINRERKSLAEVIQPPSMPQDLESSAWPEQLPVPRSCTLFKWPMQLKSYGFNMQAERNTPGHYIGKVDPGSPAEHGGIIVNWRICAVNGDSILNEPHTVVVEKIKSSGDQVRLLIAARETVAYCIEKNVTISENMRECEVHSFQTPLHPPADAISSLTPPSEVTASVIAEPTEPTTPVRPSTPESPVPPTPPSPLPMSPDQNKQPESEDPELDYLKSVRNNIGTRRLKDSRRQPNRDIKKAFDIANNL